MCICGEQQRRVCVCCAQSCQIFSVDAKRFTLLLIPTLLWVSGTSWCFQSEYLFGCDWFSERKQKSLAGRWLRVNHKPGQFLNPEKNVSKNGVEFFSQNFTVTSENKYRIPNSNSSWILTMWSLDVSFLQVLQLSPKNMIHNWFA